MELLLFLYFSCAVALMVYGINCHVMITLFKRVYGKRSAEDREILKRFYGGLSPMEGWRDRASALPVVTTQLPIFNELNVAERLIDAVAAMDYPREKHEIQVLDDSTDETRGMVARKVARLQEQGVHIHHITRERREGYKAGALKHGMAKTRGLFLAIFDADFVPPRDFLVNTVPFFLVFPTLGFVQARWGHLNPTQSLITQVQAIGIDGHFVVEQLARNASGFYMNFNGTAGIFRKQAILDAGNWEADTLTEDMDLSYRIQLAGWKCRYLIDQVVPAEIPTDINALKGQQFRWAKGSIQTAIKLLPRVFRADVAWCIKLQALLHMLHYLVHPLMLFLAIMALPVLAMGGFTVPAILFLVFGGMLVLSCIGPSRLYLVSERTLNQRIDRVLFLLPIMIGLGCGLAVNNTRAVLEALLKRQTPFVRTPKNGFARKKAYTPARDFVFVIEILLGLWCLVGMYFYFASSLYLVGHFLLLYAAGFLSIGWLSWRHSRKNQ